MKIMKSCGAWSVLVSVIMIMFSMGPGFAQSNPSPEKLAFRVKEANQGIIIALSSMISASASNLGPRFYLVGLRAKFQDLDAMDAIIPKNKVQIRELFCDLIKSDAIVSSLEIQAVALNIEKDLIDSVIEKIHFVGCIK